MVEKHGLRSIGTYCSPSRRASVNSFSKAAWKMKPAARARPIIRFRKLRGQTSQGSPSSVMHVAEQPRGARGIRQHGEGVEVGHEPDLADGAERGPRATS